MRKLGRGYRKRGNSQMRYLNTLFSGENDTGGLTVLHQEANDHSVLIGDRIEILEGGGKIFRFYKLRLANARSYKEYGGGEHSHLSNLFPRSGF